MNTSNLFKTSTSLNSPLDGSTGDSGQPLISDFLTIQSLTNFAAMSGAITAAWNALKALNQLWFSAIWVPFLFAALFGMVSIMSSLDVLKDDKRKVAGALFVALINALVLASSVVGASVVASPTP